MLNSKHIQIISNKTLILVNSTLAKWMFITISYLKQQHITPAPIYSNSKEFSAPTTGLWPFEVSRSSRCDLPRSFYSPFDSSGS